MTYILAYCLLYFAEELKQLNATKKTGDFTDLF